MGREWSRVGHKCSKEAAPVQAEGVRNGMGGLGWAKTGNEGCS